MGISTDKQSGFVTGVADVRHTPLGRLAQGADGTGGPCRVQLGEGPWKAAVVRFQSAI
jgi:hypothetical protein